MNEDQADEANTPLSTDAILDLLSDRRRRYLLYCLSRYTNPVSLPRIADWITEWELNTPADDVPKERLRVYMELYHHHVPKLTEAGVVEYSQDEDMVEFTVTADKLDSHLEHAAEHETVPSDWSEDSEPRDDASPFSG